MPIIKDRDGVQVGTGRFTISRFVCSLSGTGEITGQMLSKFGDGIPVKFNGRVVGDPDNVVGEQPLSDGQFVLPYGQQVDLGEVTFWTESHLPMTILDIEWEGQYYKRGKRISASPQSG